MCKRINNFFIQSTKLEARIVEKKCEASKLNFLTICQYINTFTFPFNMSCFDTKKIELLHGCF